MKKILFMLLLSTTIIFAENDDFDENFDNVDFEEDIVIDKPKDFKEINKEFNKTKFSVTGNIEDKLTYFINKNYLYHDKSHKNNSLNNRLKTTLDLDGRFKDGVKLYSQLEYIYNSNFYYRRYNDEFSNLKEHSKDEFTTKELFLDFNINRAVYFRAGKQNIKWGRGILWNPTDLISIEKKNIINYDQNREGAKGLRVHIPFGLENNTYLFVATGDLKQSEDIGYAAKHQFLIEDTEMSLSIYHKDGYSPIYGFDISTTINSIAVYGELSMIDGKDVKKVDSLYNIKTESGYKPKIVLGFLKYFDYKDEDSKFSINSEIFYNGFGYSDGNLFNLMANNLYVPNEYGKFYLGNFFTINKFIHNNNKLQINSISNLSDNSHMVIIGNDYEYIRDLILSAEVIGFFGKDDKEMTISNNSYALSFSANYRF